MISIIYMNCKDNHNTNICKHFVNTCNDIIHCVEIQGINASWQELFLALLSAIKSFEHNENIARKIENEFYVRFFAERQLHRIFNTIIPKFRVSATMKIALLHHREAAARCIEANISKLDSYGGCALSPKPSKEATARCFSEYIYKRLGINTNLVLDDKKIHRIFLGIIGCSHLFIKE
uniref:Uncharacterized protein n=1 Tax=Ignisphaera aggregans TaxID=334771 RepID=A0A7C2V9S7_9CREN